MTSLAQRSRRKRVQFSPEEDQICYRLRCDGLGLNRIAAQLTQQFGRPIAKATVAAVLKRVWAAQDAAKVAVSQGVKIGV